MGRRESSNIDRTGWRPPKGRVARTSLRRWCSTPFRPTARVRADVGPVTVLASQINARDPRRLTMLSATFIVHLK
jgi:hypothetical protein